MKKLGLLFLLLCLAPRPGWAVSAVFNLPSGARALYAVPDQRWNGSLIVFAHGYTAVTEPLDFQNLEFGELNLPELAQRLGFAFATTTYRQTGLAVLEGVEDIRETVELFRKLTRSTPRRTYMVGASEGGLVTVLALERYPELFSGGLSFCGPIGNFDRQMDYISDFRVLFDYFFPGVLPAGVEVVPPELMADWYTRYEPAVVQALRSEPQTALELLRVAGAAYDPADFSTVENTATTLLWYHAFGTNDAREKLRGNPYDNSDAVYHGSSDDSRLNALVERHTEDPITRWTGAPYETSGVLSRPLVVLHTTGDELVPVWHATDYLRKSWWAGTRGVYVFPVQRYGHCQFTAREVVAGFAVLLSLTR